MDGLIEFARKFSHESDFQAKFSEQLTKAGKKLTGTVDKVLNDFLLTPSEHGIAYAELLAYKLQNATPANEVKNIGEFVDQCRTLFYQIPVRDVASVGKALTHIARQLTKILIQTERFIRGVGPLKAIVQKISLAEPNVLTGIHTDLLLLTLKSHSYDLIADLSFLRPTATADGFSILSLNPSSWSLSVEDYLQFWFYLGNYHSACKKFVEAQEAYSMTLTMPSHGAVSAIQVESYKKLILVSLLAQGEVPPLNSRLTPPAVMRYLDALSGPYLDLAKAYRKSTTSSSNSVVTEMQHLVEANGQQLMEDKNVGLIKQIIKSLTKKQITKLTQTYITYSLGDIAQQVNLVPSATGGAQQAPQPAPATVAERYVFDMICANEVFAKLNSKAGMVQFLDDPEEYDTTAFIDSMDSRIKDVAALSDKLGELERELQVTPAYLLKSGALGGRGGGGAMGDDIALATALSLADQRGGGMGGMMGMGGRGGYDDGDDEMKLALEASLVQQ